MPFEHDLIQTRVLRSRFSDEAVGIYGCDLLEGTADGDRAFERQEELRQEYQHAQLFLRELLTGRW
jgi:hypothetical protein